MKKVGRPCWQPRFPNRRPVASPHLDGALPEFVPSPDLRLAFLPRETDSSTIVRLPKPGFVPPPWRHFRNHRHDSPVQIHLSLRKHTPVGISSFRSGFICQAGIRSSDHRSMDGFRRSLPFVCPRPSSDPLPVPAFSVFYRPGRPSSQVRSPPVSGVALVPSSRDFQFGRTSVRRASSQEPKDRGEPQSAENLQTAGE